MSPEVEDRKKSGDNNNHTGGVEVSLEQDIETGQVSTIVKEEDNENEEEPWFVNVETQTLHIGAIASPKDAAVDTAITTSTAHSFETRRQRREREERERREANYTCPKLQKVDVLWWFAIIIILLGAFFVALFFGPVDMEQE